MSVARARLGVPSVAWTPESLALAARGEKARRSAPAPALHHPDLRPGESALSPPPPVSVAHAPRGQIEEPSGGSEQAGWRAEGLGRSRTPGTLACGPERPSGREAARAAGLNAAGTRPFRGPKTSPGRAGPHRCPGSNPGGIPPPPGAAPVCDPSVYGSSSLKSGWVETGSPSLPRDAGDRMRGEVGSPGG